MEENRNYWESRRVTRRSALRAAGLTAVGSAGLAIVGCGDDDDATSSASPSAVSSSPQTQPTQAVAAKKGGSLKVAIGAQPDGLSGSLNSSGKFDTFWQQIYNCLVWFDENMASSGKAAGLASSWERTDDKTYVFTLKQGVTFHDGTPFDADVVKFNIERVLDPKTNAPARAQFAPVVASVAALDKYKVQFNLKRADASLLGLLADRGGVMESPAAIQKYGNDGIKMNPVGTGPFKLKEWIKDDHITLSRFDGYKADGDGSYPYLDEVVWKVIPQETVQVAAIRSGDVDFIDLPIAAISEFKGDSNFRVMRKDGVGWLGFFLNCSLAPLDDVRVRQAISYAIDRDKLIKGAYAGQSKPSIGPIWEALSSYYDATLKPQTYDKKKAEALLQEAGFKSGDVKFEVSATPPSGQAGYGVAGEQPEVIVQSMLKEVGIEMKITPVGKDTFDRFWFKDQNLHGYSSGYSLRSDPGDMMFGAYHKDGTYNAGHGSGDDPKRGRFDEVSNLIVQANSEYDVAKRKSLFSKAQQIINDDVRSLFFADNFRVIALRKEFDGFTWYGAGKGSYRTVHRA